MISPSSMTDGAQQALRRIMEIYSKTTRFALACNASDKIIEPIQSRCAVLRYSKLTDGQILARLQEVVEKEGLSVSDDGLEAVIFTAQGDMRQVRVQRVQRSAQKTHTRFADFLFVSRHLTICSPPTPASATSIARTCSKCATSPTRCW